MKSLLRITAASAALAAVGIASSASAATTASADATAEILTALSVTVDPNDKTLNFGTIADGGLTAPAQIVVAANGTFGGCPTNLICSGAGTTDSPTFNVKGLGDMDVYVRFVNASETLNLPTGTIVPTGMASTLSVGSFTTNATGNKVHTLLADGTASFTVGGTLTVNKNQAPGVYTGTVSVSVAYN